MLFIFSDPNTGEFRLENCDGFTPSPPPGMAAAPADEAVMEAFSRISSHKAVKAGARVTFKGGRFAAVEAGGAEIAAVQVAN